jgi:hypothetical protein
LVAVAVVVEVEVDEGDEEEEGMLSTAPAGCWADAACFAG